MSGQEAVCFNFATDVMERWAERSPHDLALWCVDESGDHEQRFTFAQLAEQFRRAAHLFHKLGVQRGDRVLVILPRVPQWWIAMLGLTKLGAVPIPGTVLLTAKDIRYRIEAAEVAAVITCGEVAERVDDFTGIKIVAGEERAGWVAFDAGLRAARADFEPAPTRADEPGIIFFTSGTTGPPKMVLHTQESYGLGHRVTGEQWLCCQPHDIHWNLADNGWAKAAWSSLFGPWHMGACVFTIDSSGKFDAAAALRTLMRYPITTWCAPPTALRLIVREDLAAYCFPHLRHCVSAGEPLNPEVIETWQRATGLTIYEGYGQTETVVLIASCRARGDEVRPGSMGRPTPGFEVALLDADLREVPDGLEGEVAVRVAPRRPLGLFREYWRNPEENAVRFRGDWYLTGDRATRDAEGRYWFVGRNDDVIKSAGYRIGPFEVESALVEHPAVVEAAVVAKFDAMRGAIVKAFVVLRKGATPGEELKRELQEHCKRVTAPYKYPREIEFLAELPKTISGKIRRLELRARG
ncbi:MAG: acetyl-CoA synthetase [Chthoniobacter sp.]|jgi:acetyl-CoA synthetase/medium-chain acyl-CoA synthetase|nr:acetyl-CoA synthetase [Chthoniobacter sp.]